MNEENKKRSADKERPDETSQSDSNELDNESKLVVFNFKVECSAGTPGIKQKKRDDDFQAVCNMVDGLLKAFKDEFRYFTGCNVQPL